MESLQIQDIGSVLVNTVAPADEWDQAFKPGIYAQTETFLGPTQDALCSLSEHLEHWHWYSQICGYE